MNNKLNGMLCRPTQVFPVILSAQTSGQADAQVRNMN